MEALHLVVGKITLDVGKGSRVRHVDGDGVAVTEGNVRGKLVKRRPAVRNVSAMIIGIQTSCTLTCGRMQ